MHMTMYKHTITIMHKPTHVQVHIDKQTFHSLTCTYSGKKMFTNISSHIQTHTEIDPRLFLEPVAALQLLCNAQSYLLLGLKWPFRRSHCG